MSGALLGGAPGAIVGLGMATLDALALVPRLPGPDEVLRVDALESAGGGPVATALVAAARLGSRTAILGVAGRDAAGDRVAAELVAEGVDVTGLLRRAHGRTAEAVILIDARDGRRSILYHPGDLPPLQPHEVPSAPIREAALLHLDGVHPEAALHAARIARAAGVRVAFDGGAGGPWPGTDALLPLVQVLIVARAFARNLTGFDDPEAAGPALSRLGSVREVVITDGAAGAWSWSDAGYLHQPAFSVAVRDTTGAGDAFHGAYLHALAAGLPPAARLRAAAAVGALACTRLGGRAGLPDAAALARFLAERA